MERFLITQSLLSSWAYTFDCYPGNEEQAKEDFLRVLNREKTEPTEAMQNGIDFERECYAAAAGLSRQPHPKWETGIQSVASIITGAQVQVRLSRNLELNGMTFLTYGILDALKAGVIYDVKFSSKPLDSKDLYGKYLNSAQHPMYFYLVPEAYQFQYLVSDGEDVYIETYNPQDCRFINDIIKDFIQSIDSMGLLPIYHEKWLAK